MTTRSRVIARCLNFLIMVFICVDYFSIKETGIIGHTIQDLMDGVNMTDLMTGINITNITYQLSDQWSELSNTLTNYTTAEEDDEESSDGTTAASETRKERTPIKGDLTTHTALRLDPSKLKLITKNQTSPSQPTETATSPEVPKESSTENKKPRNARRKKQNQPPKSEPKEEVDASTAQQEESNTADATTTESATSRSGHGKILQPHPTNYSNILQPHPTNYKKPYFKKAGVHVLQIADAKYAEKMAVQVQRNREWVNCTGYTYRLETFPKSALSPKQLRNRGIREPCPYTTKVKKMYDLLMEIPLGDWLIFLDIDVQFQATTCDAMEQMLPQQSQLNSKQCEVMIHSSGQTINTAIVVVQATEATRKLLKDWYDFQSAHPVCDGCADQYALQEVILRTYAPDYREQASPCWRRGPKNKNSCFLKNFPQSKRSVGNLCLMPCTKEKVTLQCRDCWSDPCDVDKAIFWHNRSPRLDLHPLNQSTYYSKEL